jgi:thiamine-monophosphate kinase
MPGEFDIIRWVREQRPVGGRNDFVLVPPGDDLAVLKWQADDLLLIGCDQVLDGVHFDSRTAAPRQVGRKVMNRNLSDCAAMACLPAAAVVTVALPRGAGDDYAKELYLGLRDAADPFDCPVVGGDTASWDGKLVMTVSILGRSAGVEPVTRKGARPGDGIYVTGPLGGSILGRHLTFEPRVTLARQIVPSLGPTAMIDLSDGLSRDLGHICEESNVGAVIDADAVPIHDDALLLMRRDGIAPLEHALHDGEDYELLLTAKPRKSFLTTRIGTVVEAAGVWLQTDAGRERLEPRGWEHKL